MAVSTAQIPVGTTATLLSGVDPGSGGAPNGQSLVLSNTGAATVFIGGPGVTTTTGYPVPAGAEYSLDLDGLETLFAIVATGTVTVAVLRTGV